MNLEEMDFAALLDLADEFRPYLFALILSLVRAYAFMSASQILAPTAVPRLARQAAILVIVIPIVPANLAAARDFDPSIPEFAVFFLKEYALGFLLGYMVAWLFWAVQAAGAFIDNQRGAAIAASIDPSPGVRDVARSQSLFKPRLRDLAFLQRRRRLPASCLDLIYQSYVSRPCDARESGGYRRVRRLSSRGCSTRDALMFVLCAPIKMRDHRSSPSFALLPIVSRFAPQGAGLYLSRCPLSSHRVSPFLIFYFAHAVAVAADNADLFRPLNGSHLFDPAGRRRAPRRLSASDLAPGGR